MKWTKWLKCWHYIGALTKSGQRHYRVYAINVYGDRGKNDRKKWSIEKRNYRKHHTHKHILALQRSQSKDKKEYKQEQRFFTFFPLARHFRINFVLLFFLVTSLMRCTSFRRLGDTHVIPLHVVFFCFLNSQFAVCFCALILSVNLIHLQKDDSETKLNVWTWVCTLEVRPFCIFRIWKNGNIALILTAKYIDNKIHLIKHEFFVGVRYGNDSMLEKKRRHCYLSTAMKPNKRKKIAKYSAN